MGFINSYNAYSQEEIVVDKWMEYVEELAEETEDSERIEALYTDLSYLTEHPLDLNTVTEEQLIRLPFLSDKQIDGFIRYRQRHGKLLSVYELKLVEELDFQTIALLLPFVYVGDISVEKRQFTVKNLLKYGRNELQIRYNQCFQQKSGYRSRSDSVLSRYPNRSYRGEPFYHSLRYSYLFDDRLQAGVVAEKDAGEPFWNRYHKGYDYYSAHLFLKDMGRLRSLALGDYKMSFGQGLVVSNDFSPGRSGLVTQVGRRTNGFRRHFSTNEQDFFRGVAAAIDLRRWRLHFFYSFRKMDAGVDSLRFSSLKTDGLHRLPRDWEKRRTIPLQVVGGNIQYQRPDLRIGLTALYHSFGKYRLEPDWKPYNQFYLSGSDHFNISVDYLLRNDNLKFYGETAIARNGAVATLNALEMTPDAELYLVALFRHYDRRYQSLFGNAFSQSSAPQNEQGVYLGMRLAPFRFALLSLYADLFRFPWMRYGVEAPSVGQEYMARLDYDFRREVSTYLRYKFRRSERSRVDSERGVLRMRPRTQHRLRWQWTYSLSHSLTGKTSLDGILYETDSEPPGKGWMVAQSVGWKPASLPFQADGYIAWFHTDDYDTRISSYEKNILYSFYMPTFYGKGLRVAFTCRMELWRRLSLSLKLAHTHYRDRDRIGTDTEEITGANKTDLYALLRWKF